MLSNRLALVSTQLERELRATPEQGEQVLQLLAGTEQFSARLALESWRLPPSDTAGLVPPAVEPIWPALAPPFDPATEIEPIALRVPRDCAYIRFGRFTNFLWLNNLLEEYGGDIGKLVATRGFSQPLNEKLQTQLALKQDALAELLGETVIADVALVGRDFFFAEGASVGLLFQAKQSALFARDLAGKRQAAQAREQASGAKLETIRIEDRDVSFLSTPDNRLRSFYVSDGDFHLVTTSRTMVEQFLRAPREHSSLGETAEFRFARGRLPLSREDTVFAYLSSDFLRGLVSHAYQVELRRRLQSTVAMQQAYLARLAAAGEGVVATSEADLIAGGFLPPGFGRRADGSSLVFTAEGALDTLRGARGTFTPIADLPLTAVSPEERAHCERLTRYYAEHWRQLDPLFVGIQRFKLNDQGLERIQLTAHVAPFEETKYGWVTGQLGPASGMKITAAQGDVIQLQAFLAGGLLDRTVGPHHLFLGVQDHVPLENVQGASLLQMLQLLRTTPGYLGAWPKTGFLDRLPLGLGGGPPDAWGYSRLPLGLWRRQGEGFSVLSFDPALLAEVTPQLAVAEEDDLAQIRVHVGNLAETKVAGLIHALYYEQARRTSLGNARFMSLLEQQFHVPLDDARATAEQLLNAQLSCTLGGEYRIRQWPGGGETWSSTALPERTDYTLPEGYVSPLLVWFRGLDVGVTKLPDQLVVTAQLDMQRNRPEKNSLNLPLFNLFGGQKPEGTKSKTPPQKLFPRNPVPPEPMPDETVPGNTIPNNPVPANPPVPESPLPAPASR
jgi:hypothetical protein